MHPEPVLEDAGAALGPASSGRLWAPRFWAYVSGSLGTQALYASLGAYLPSLLEHRVAASPIAIGWIVAIPPLFGLTVQPLVNAWSDRLHSRWGRRRPFLLAGAPLVAAGLAALPFVSSLAAAVALMALVALGSVLVDGPYRASTSEEWPGDETFVSAVQALIKGLGTLVTFALVAWLGERAFVAAAGVWLLTVLGAAIAIRPDTAAAPAAPPDARFSLPGGDGGRFLLGLFLAWFGLLAVSAFSVSYMVHDLAGVAAVGSAAGQAATREAMLMLSTFAATAMAMALPIGHLARRHGRSRVLVGALLVLAAGYAAALFAHQSWQVFAFALLGGVGFAALQVLPYPLLLETVAPGREGRLSSFYSATMDLSQLTTMILCGWLIATAGTYRVIFTVALAATLAAVWLLAARPKPAPLPHPLEV